MKPNLPWTAKDIFSLSLKDRLIYDAVIAFHRASGLWRYPIPASGDMETMTRKDLIYWLYKAQFPVKRATRNSGLEAFFERNSSLRWALPDGFTEHRELQLASAGDLMNHSYLQNSRGFLYEDVAETVFGADISMANLECVVYPQGSDSFTFTPRAAPPLYYKSENFDAAKGFQGKNYSFVTTANNHSLDCGEAGVKSTIHALRSDDIAFNGMNVSEEDACSATLIERKGFKIGLIAHTFGVNAKKPPKDKPWLVNRTHLNNRVTAIDFSQIEKQVRFCREKKVDAVVGQLHWGLEHEYYPRHDQLEVAHHLAEIGFDVVIGHHAHVIQPMEHYRTQRDPDRVVPIYYSLGNLITPFSHPAFRLSGVAQIKLAKGACPDGKTRTYVKAAGLTEVFQEKDEKYGRIRLTRPAHHQA